MNITIAELLQSARKARKISTDTLAVSTGLPKHTVTLYMTGDRIPTAAHFTKLCAFLAIDPAPYEESRARAERSQGVVRRPRKSNQVLQHE